MGPKLAKIFMKFLLFILKIHTDLYLFKYVGFPLPFS